MLAGFCAAVFDLIELVAKLTSEMRISEPKRLALPGMGEATSS